MKASANPSPKEKSASQQIDAIIKEAGLKTLILDAVKVNMAKESK